MTDQIVVQPGGELDIQDGGSATGTTWPAAVYVQGGTANISGGTVSGITGVYVQSGTANITGGSISGDSTHTGVYVQGGSVNIWGGSFSGNQNVWVAGGTVSIAGGSMPGPVGAFVTDGTLSISGGSVSGAVLVGGGTVSIYGSCLALSGSDQLTGTLQDGTLINTATAGLSTANLFGAATAPVVTLNGDSTMTVECHTTFSDPGATGYDSCAGPLPAAVSFGSVDTSTPGTYKLTYAATDPSGNTGWVNRWVTVVGATPPVVTLNGDSAMTVECHSNFTDPRATARDACGGSLPVTLFFGSVDANTPGTYKLTYTATDRSGNSGYVNRWVTVADTTAPVVTLNGADQLTVECHSSFTDPGATAKDDCAGPLPATLSFGSVDTGTPGTYKLTYTATDPSGNGGYVNRWVTVVDTTKPTVTPPANIIQAAAAKQCSATVPVGIATAVDTCAGTLTPVGTRSDGKALTAPYPGGTTVITWTATDPSGNSASATQTVTVTNSTAPTITCPANITVPATSASGAVVNFTVGASNSCSGVSVVSTPPSGSVFPIGTTTVRSIATDVSGNSASCSFTVTVTIADLALTMSAKPNQARPNSNLTYTLAVKNSGNQAAQNVVLTDPLPAGVTFVSASGSPSTGTLTTPPAGGAGAVSWSIGTLGSGQSVTLTLVVKTGATTGTITNAASVSCSVEKNLSNNGATVTTSVR